MSIVPNVSNVPGADVAVPSAMAEVAGGPVTLIWQNGIGGLTGRVDGEPPRYIKWNRLGSETSLAAEAERMRWLAARHPAPTVLEHIVTDDAEMLITAAVTGRSAVDPVWRARPKDAIRAVAEGLRSLHGLPVADCPFDWDVATRIMVAEANGYSVPRALRSPPPIDRLVVCHADACAPNTLVDDDGGFAGTVDVGRLGVADRWADLAIATLSFEWNYDDVDETIFWDTYGVEPDAERIVYYRALWNAT